MKSWHFILFLLLATLAGKRCQAVELTSWKFTHFGYREGIGHPLVMSFFQDSYGFMWIGTKHGIYRFNGIQVRAYRTAKNQTAPLKDIFHIQEDPYRRLWTIASGTILKYNLKSDSFETVAPVSDQPVYNMFHIDRRHRFWCHWSDTLRTYRITKEGELTPLKKYAISIHDIRGYDEDAAGRIWCISESQGIFRIHPETGAYQNRLLTSNTSQPMALRCLKILSNQMVCTGGYLWGMVILDTGLKVLHHEYFGREDDRGLRSIGVRGILELSNYQGQPSLLLGTNNQGLVVYHCADHHYEAVNSPEWSEACHDLFIRTLYRDREGNIWVGTISEGAYALFRKRQWFHSNYLPLPTTSGLQNTVNYLAADIDFPNTPIIWCNSMNTGILGLNLLTGSWTPLLSGDNLNNTFAFYQLSKDEFLIGNTTETYSLLHRVKRNGPRSKISIRHLLEKDSSFHGEKFSTFVHDIGMPEPDLVYISDVNRGLFTYRLSNGQVEWLYTPFNKGYGIPTKRADAICSGDSNGIYIACHDDGIFRLDKTTRLIREVKPRMNGQRISLIQIQSICSSPNHRFLYLASIDGEGLYILDTHEDTCFQLTEKHGLSNNHCINVTCDENGRVWMNTEAGLDCYDPKTGRFWFFDQKDGYKNTSVSYGMFLKKSILFSGGNSCLITTNIDTLLQNESNKPALLVDEIRSAGGILARCFSGHQDGRSIPYNKNSLSVSFNLMDLFRAGSAVYRYKIEGGENTWKEIGHQNSLNLTNMSPGNYLLRIQAGLTSGVWMSESSYGFTVENPWYRSTWFFLGLMLALSALIWLGYRWRLNTVRKEAGLQQKLSELQLSSLRSQMNPHFIFNSLNSIQRFILQRDTRQASNYLNQFAQLMRSILDHSHEQEVSLHSEIDLLNNYVQLEQLRFEGKFKYVLEANPDINTLDTFIPGMILQPFIENAIWHGLMNKEGEGLLSIRFSRRGQMLECRIEDNGIGRKASSEIKANQGSTYISRGMQITKARMEALNRGDIRNTHYQIEDLYEADGRAAGTRAIILFQLKPSKSDAI